jgi:hypothetical protein
VLVACLKNTRLATVTFFISLLFGASTYYGFTSLVASNSSVKASDLIVLSKDDDKQAVDTNVKFSNLRWLNSVERDIEFTPIIISSLIKVKKQKSSRLIKTTEKNKLKISRTKNRKSRGNIKRSKKRRVKRNISKKTKGKTLRNRRVKAFVNTKKKKNKQKKAKRKKTIKKEKKLTVVTLEKSRRQKGKVKNKPDIYRPLEQSLGINLVQ